MNPLFSLLVAFFFFFKNTPKATISENTTSRLACRGMLSRGVLLVRHPFNVVSMMNLLRQVQSNKKSP